VEVECHAEASAEPPTVNCSGSCSGEVTPPSASAECEASAKAEAELNAECTPPSVDVSYSFAATADAQVQAEFEAWLHGFKANMGALAAATAKADIVLRAGADLGAAASGAIQGVADTLAGEADFAVAFKLACLPAQLDATATVITDATAELTASATASASFVTGLKKK